jgi:hypothetical protein
MKPARSSPVLLVGAKDLAGTITLKRGVKRHRGSDASAASALDCGLTVDARTKATQGIGPASTSAAPPGSSWRGFVMQPAAHAVVTAIARGR